MSQTIKMWLLIGVLSCASATVCAQDNSDTTNADSNASNAAAQQTPAPSNSTVVYKSIDKDGKTVFADTPPTDRPADTVTVQRPNTIQLPAGNKWTAEEKKLKPPYNSLEVTEPKNEQLFGQEVQSILLKAVVRPPVRQGHIAQMYYDGAPIGVGFMVTQTQLERGAHTVVAKVLDDAGNLVVESAPVQFFVRRTSVLNQHKPQPADTDSGNGGSGSTAGAPPPPSGFGGAKGFGGSGGAGGGKAAGGASGAGGIGGAAPTPGR